MNTLSSGRIASLAIVAALASCDASTAPSSGLNEFSADGFAAVAPPADQIVAIVAGGASLSVWPYTGTDLAGAAADPVNLVFSGHADQRGIRQALMSLDGDRTAFGFPPVFPFDCRWSDAMGDLQTGYATVSGWAGSAVQLGCGSFDAVRFHLRLFDIGAVTLGAAHFEVLIPGTADHQVISWELAEQLVTADLIRAGIIAPAQLSLTVPINPAPYRSIPAVLYNELPAELQQAIQGPAGPAESDVGIGTDGRATIVHIASELPVDAGVDSDQSLSLTYGQTIPRPFCSDGPLDWVHVAGPIELRKRVSVTGSGRLVSQYHASGRLTVTPLDVTGERPVPAGESYEAQIQDDHETAADATSHMVRGLSLRAELPPSAPGRGKLTVKLRIGPNGLAAFDRDERCTP